MIQSLSPWTAVYTKSRYEKKVYNRLISSSVEAYLPIYKTLKIWSDRKKWVDEPLIKSYVFVRSNEQDHLNILQLPGVVKFIQFGGEKAKIPNVQIDNLRKLLEEKSDLEITDQLIKPGDPVIITGGNLKGVSGELVSYKGKKKVLIQIDHVSSSLLVNISPGNLQLRSSSTGRGL